jgi:hypothetical protein
VRYAALLAAAVAQHPAAIGLELINEAPLLPFAPPFLEPALYTLYAECYAAVRAVSDDLAVGIGDAGQMAARAPTEPGTFANALALMLAGRCVLAQYCSDDTRLPPAHQRWLRDATHLLCIPAGPKPHAFRMRW